MAPKIYLAGFDVFYPDAKERAVAMKVQCAALGLEGVFPADVDIDPTGLTAAELQEAIFRRDVYLIDECDIIAANLNPFRGSEPDSGTCFEVGYGYAKGKALYGYTGGPSSMAERVDTLGGGSSVDAAGDTVDAAGMTIENFGSPINLMLSVPSAMTLGTFAECLEKIAADFGTAVQEPALAG